MTKPKFLPYTFPFLISFIEFPSFPFSSLNDPTQKWKSVYWNEKLYSALIFFSVIFL